MSENGEIYTTGKNFTLPLGVTGVTNSTSVMDIGLYSHEVINFPIVVLSIFKRVESVVYIHT